MTSMITGDALRLYNDLEPVRVRHTRLNEMLVVVLSQTYSAFAEWWRGHGERAAAMAQEMFAWIDRTADVAPERPFACLPNSILAEVHWSWNDLEKARFYADRAIDHGRKGFMLGLFESARVMARVAISQRDWEMANRALGEAHRAIRNAGSHFYWAYAAEAQSRLLLFRRWQAEGNPADLEAVEKWMRESDIPGKLMPANVRRFEGIHSEAPMFVAVRVMIEREKYAEAMRVLDDILPHTIPSERIVAQSEVLILQSIIAARRNRMDEASDLMRRALELTSGPRYAQLFVDEGSVVVPIIERAAPRIADRDFVTRILSSFSVPQPIIPKLSIPEMLSDREIEVLRLIASGVSNSEAGRKLFIAPSTVKKHLENIYAKLEVSGRTQAIARAHELRLL
jgi:LuxR family maltose regulon positive regulatory protein